MAPSSSLGTGGLAITIELEENVSAALGRAIAAGSDLTPAMQEIANHLAFTTSKRFEDEEGPTGAKWQQSARAKAQGGKTLTDRGDLKGSIRPDWGRDYAAAGPEASGGAAIYARIHQLGDSRTIPVRAHTRTVEQAFGKKLLKAVVANVVAFSRKQNMPARPYLGFDEVNRRTIVEILTEHLGAALGGRGA
jgi:phage virion morphogenesis protein